MAILDELITQIENPELRARIAAEVEKLAKQKKFGLVFEEHLPECTPLWDIPVKRGSKVALKAGQVNDFYTVLNIEDGVATCLNKDKSATLEFTVDELVSVAEFGESIYPYLKPIDAVCNAPDSDLWHTLIEADNYHALQLLEYLYVGKVDCIYIDPPYNTGARDWKYNNDYVDGADQYRHSKWLSFIQKRLQIAKKLLNPKDSVLIVTIDEKEYLHLGCLLEEMFPEARIQMISTIINPAGASRQNEFCRMSEYIFFVQLGNSSPCSLKLDAAWAKSKQTKSEKANWDSLVRSGPGSNRTDRPNMFYPILISADGKKVLGAGDPLHLSEQRDSYVPPEDCIVVWPIRSDGTEGRWRIGKETFLKLYEEHFVKIGGITKKGIAIYYLKSGEQEKVLNGTYNVSGINDDNSYNIIGSNEEPTFLPGDIWNIPSHNASAYGSVLLKSFIGNRFSFPKSLYAVHDVIRFFVANKPAALIVDFFAGSGTTLHAVNLLNAEDGGHRRCIMVTNNEVSVEEAKTLTAQGYHPGDEEWEKLGIARYVTWSRTVCSIEGHDVNGNPLKGNYIGSDKPMVDGFKTNAAFFKLGFLDKNAVALGRQFKEMLPTLWMKAGAHGLCPTIGEQTPDMLILPENKFAVLADEKQYMEFVGKLDEHPEIETVFIVTDSESGYREMIAGLNVKDSYQLYRDYLDNFCINSVRR